MVPILAPHWVFFGSDTHMQQSSHYIQKKKEVKWREAQAKSRKLKVLKVKDFKAETRL